MPAVHALALALARNPQSVDNHYWGFCWLLRCDGFSLFFPRKYGTRRPPPALEVSKTKSMVGAAPGRGDAGHRLIAQASTGSRARSQKVVRSLARDVGLGTTRRRVVLDVLILEVPGGR